MLTRFLDWLDRQDGLVFFVILWLIRWPIVLPVAWLQQLIAEVLGGTSDVDLDVKKSAVVVFFFVVIVSPVVETLIECTLPYAIMMRGGRLRPPRPWGFIVVSALIMAILHLPFAFPAGFVTGAFIAYCYGHFATRSQPRAFLIASAYHAAINCIGFAMVFLASD